ncbi:uncharacterized protein LOC131648835 [Vicia villosa]|uniref:uncharacterized protein LOC131648821 n=1 Tax=Vicia villosa TaxID=3911 RepID=UPI00273B5939|nr:uncharacterized protein LOC131648821 [Vicia villosa]XP_058774548.1 uncharacterized protein LOC131648835 [Vicia villosa]
MAFTKKALIVAFEYPCSDVSLYGPSTAALRMKECLVNYYGFLSEDVMLAIDDVPTLHPSFPKAQALQPSFFTVADDLIFNNSKNTKKQSKQSRTICTTLAKMVSQSNVGDTILFYYIGHGNRRQTSYTNNSGWEEFMLCGDGSRIYDYHLREVASYVPDGVNFTVVAECCNSGGLIEGLFEVIGNSTRSPVFGNKRPERNFGGNGLQNSPPLAVLISSTQSNEGGAIGYNDNLKEHKCFLTDAIINIIMQKEGIVTNLELVKEVSRMFEEKNLEQSPGLYCNRGKENSYFLGLEGLKVKKKDKKKEDKVGKGKGKEKM